MPFSARDKRIIRDLASKYMELASREEQKTRRQRMLDTINIKNSPSTVMMNLGMK
jgi:hypothetical protein